MKNTFKHTSMRMWIAVEDDDLPINPLSPDGLYHRYDVGVNELAKILANKRYKKVQIKSLGKWEIYPDDFTDELKKLSVLIEKFRDKFIVTKE